MLRATLPRITSITRSHLHKPSLAQFATTQFSRGKKSKSKASKSGGDIDIDAGSSSGNFSFETFETELRNELNSKLTKLKDDISSAKTDIGRVIMSLGGGLAGSTGSAAQMLDNIRVPPSNEPIKALGQAYVKDPGVLTLSLFSIESVDSVRKAIFTAGLGLNPQVDTKTPSTLHIQLPKPSADTRQKALTMLTALSEKTKISIRSERQRGMKTLKRAKDESLTTDEERKLEKKLQTLVDDHSKQVDDIIAKARKRLET